MIKTPQMIDNEAAEWFVKNTNNLSPDEYAIFEIWLNADSRHRDAYNQMESVWNVLDEMKRCTKPSNVSQQNRFYNGSLFRSLGTLAAIALIIVVFIFGAKPEYFKEKPLYTQQFANGIGELSRFELPDKSEISIDTDTMIKVAFYENRREIHLEKGQVLIRAAKNPEKPMIVHASNIDVRVVGTVFEVRNVANEIRVTVEEGKVEVLKHISDEESPLKLASLLPSEQFSFNVQTREVFRSNLHKEEIASWREGRVVFNNTSLRDALAEFGRYEKHNIRIADARAKQLTITGSFNLRSRDSFMDTLPLALPVRVTDQNGVITIQSK